MNYTVVFELGIMESWETKSGRPGTLHVHNKSTQTLHWADIPPPGCTVNGSLVNASRVISLTDRPTNILQGMLVTGSANIPAGAYVTAVDWDAKQVTISADATDDDPNISITFAAPALSEANSMLLGPGREIIFDDSSGSALSGAKRFWFASYDSGGNTVAFRQPDF